MKPAPRRWEISDALPLAGQPPILGRILAGRGVDAGGCDAFIGGGAELLDPFGLEGMAEAVITLGVAVTEGRRIAVYGDYDADGVTACAMLTRALRAGGADVLPYIPNRMTEGYGLHSAALEELAARGVQCVVTVDCGTSSVEVAANRPARHGSGGDRPPPPPRPRWEPPAPGAGRRPDQPQAARPTPTASTAWPAPGWPGSFSAPSRPRGSSPQVRPRP